MSDLIDRQDTIDAISEGVRDDAFLIVALIKSKINKVPSAQRWIPCSERLPKTEVLCCDIYGEICIAYPYADRNSDTGYSAESEEVYMRNCIAWIPLPKIYRGDEDEGAV